MQNILNLTQHEASAEQLKAGVIPLHETDQGDPVRDQSQPLGLEEIPTVGELLKEGLPLRAISRDLEQPFERLKELLIFEDLPTQYEVIERAEAIAALAGYSAYLQSGGYEDPDVTAAMIGGVPFLMEPLAHALRNRGITPVYAFSRRDSEEIVQPDGSTKKVAVFRHLGFVEAPAP